ncbi:hypothetical protein [Curtobacterium ammoniigenes]|uniref:hypothetical protein n=1 Tax=Curtobacterium ammoniigenes TaxID=395387 RepID=UPI000AEA6239|nr:hypothetical protein [Curtobacterium ammoniigenes]
MSSTTGNEDRYPNEPAPVAPERSAGQNDFAAAEGGAPLDGAPVSEPAHHGAHAAGEPIDANGRPVDPAAQPVDAQGRPLNAAGEPVDAAGEPVDAAGRPIEHDRVGRNRAAAAPVAAPADAPVGATAVGAAPVAERELPPREAVVAREREEFAGTKWGSAFFGWLTATGMAVLLTALLSAVGAGVGLGTTGGNGTAASNALSKNASAVGLIGAIALAVILFVAYYCGGYVAGRMARFSGARQGFAVWIWAVIIAVVVAIVTAIAGAQYNVLGNINSFPRIPIDEGTLTVTGIITAILVAIISLGGALLGGVAGMHYHRKIDRVGLQEL